MKRLLIVGAGGHGKVVADAALLSGWDEICFVDGRFPTLQQVRQWPVIATDADLTTPMPDVDGVVVAIGNNRVRLALQRRLQAAGWPITRIIHPAACVSPFAQIGLGSVVFARAVVNIDASIGEAAIINTGAVVEHDCRLGDAVHLSPNAALAGGVTVGEASWIGIGATVRQLVTLGADVMVGAGAAVVCNIPDTLTVAGVPAREIRKS